MPLKPIDMIRPLRKRHLQIWIVWALLLPLGIVSAVMARRYIPVNAIETQNGSLLPVVIKENTWKGNTVQLRSNSLGSIQQLVWMNRQMLSIASATIYLADIDTGSIASSKYIGRIESRGNYVFDLPLKKAYHFIIYDFIHQQIVGRINFKNLSPVGEERREL
jgi:hypothetical protein